jgi:hydroxyacylglutathione hydrolase
LEKLMPLEIVSIQLGPLENNSYLLADPIIRQAVVIDPSFESRIILEEASRRDWRISAIWLTHAHFDHIAGIADLQLDRETPLPVGLHRSDLPLWQQSGGARLFGLEIDPGPVPTLEFTHGQILRLGEQSLEVRHTPGHTPGHVIFYSHENSAAIVGDLIFYRGVGRTDLPGGNHSVLLHSIREQILTLPPSTRLLSGHGAETTVEEERDFNPFL